MFAGISVGYVNMICAYDTYIDVKIKSLLLPLWIRVLFLYQPKQPRHFCSVLFKSDW